MKYRRYRIQFSGSQEIVQFLEQNTARQYNNLAAARKVGRAAKALFPSADYEIVSIVTPSPKANHVKAL